MPNGREDNFRTFGIRHSVLIVVLTLFAGFLRFGWIDKPAIWGDEAASWRRVSGTWQQLVDELRVAGFMPGHYVTLWWIKEGFPIWGEYQPGPPSEVGGGRFGERGPFEFGDRRAGRGQRLVWTPTHRLIDGGINPSPLVLRFMPALCGTLMVPAIYFLASHLVARRTALLAALFACCSCYLLNYSRDSKMYMQLWFFATLHVGCLLWWLKDYSTGKYSAIDRPLSAKQRELAEGVAGVLPSKHIDQVANALVLPYPNREDAVHDEVRRNVETRLATTLRWACWVVSGLAMISFHAVGMGIVGIEVLIFLATIPRRMGWIRSFPLPRWPARKSGDVAEKFPLVPPSQPPAIWWRLHVPPVVGFILGVWIIASLFSSYREFCKFYARVEPTRAESTQFDIGDMGIGWVESYNEGRTAGGHFLENATAYLFNWEWVKPSELPDVDPVTLGRLRKAGIILLGACAVGLLPLRRLLDRLTSSPGIHERGPMPVTALLILATWVAIPAYGFYVASGAWNDAGNRVEATLPNSTLLKPILPAIDDAPETHYLRGALTIGLKPVFAGTTTLDQARAKLDALPWGKAFAVRNFETSPVRWWAIALLVGGAAVIVLSWPTPPLPKRRASDESSEPSIQARRRRAWIWSLLTNLTRVTLVCAVLWLLLVATFFLVPAQDQSVWMPRYLGFIWPAFGIVVCVLLRRLPLLPLRWAVIALLLFVNLTNFYARVTYGEPPTGAIAADQIATGDRRTSRFFSLTQVFPGFGSPGSGFVATVPNTYYYVTTASPELLAKVSPYPITPRTVLMFPAQLGVVRLDGRSGSLKGTLSRDRQVNDMYFWATVPPDTAEEELARQVSEAIAPAWSPAEPPRRWMVYEHWTWRKLYIAERHHWKREPTTRPASGPTTRQTP